MKRIILLISLVVFGSAVLAQNMVVKYISTRDARQHFTSKIKQEAFLLFPDHREAPIQWFDSLKLKWLDAGYDAGDFSLLAQPGEYAVFQTGIWAIRKDLKNIRVIFSDLKSKSGKQIRSGEVTCFNTGGINYEGNPFGQKVNVPSGALQALWMGIRIPEAAKGEYSGQMTIQASVAAKTGTLQTVSKKINIRLTVSGELIADHGFNEGRRLSRMAWLNATDGMDGRVPKGFLPVSRKNQELHISGRSLEIGEDGLPEKITTYFTASNQSLSAQGEPLLNHPFHFVIVKDNGELIHLKPGKISFIQKSAAVVSWNVTSTSDDCVLLCEGELQFDGFAGYHLTLTAKKNLQIRDIRLELLLNKDKATYMMGLNKAGGTRPEQWAWTWDTTRNQDALWLGAVNGGLRIKWKAENYRLPLVNIYYAFGPLNLPPSWGNGGKGGVHVNELGKDVLVNAYSGSREMKLNEKLHYDFELLITPFKIMNRNNQFNDRYFHSGQQESSQFLKQADSIGANIINVHQGNDLYPFINYPYSDINKKELNQFIRTAQQDNKRVKVYYTTRELTVNLPEFFPFVSLGGEIIFPGPGATAKTLIHPGGPDPWLLDQLRGRKYIPAWVSPLSTGRYAGLRDLSLITTPNSRLNNFYIAGLNWMVKHMHIDGIYIDDCSLDRGTLNRARKILDDNRPAPRIDMHSWNHFNPEAGYASCLNLYMDLLPYIDLVWIGEGRNYNTAPDYWLTEIAGIPFGVPGQMLQDDGNPWRGMVYGITNRAGWGKTMPDAIWKFWDETGLAKMTMMGYWEKHHLVSVDNPAIRVTLFKGDTSSVLALGNFSGQDQDCSLGIDYTRLETGASSVVFDIPRIENYQEEQKDISPRHIHIPAGKGFLIVMRKK